MFSCDEDNPVSGSNEVDVDWFLIRTPNMGNWFDEEVGIGYICYYKSSLIDFSNNEFNPYHQLIEYTENGIFISFTYNEIDFSYDISDIEHSGEGHLLIFGDTVDRIIYNEEMDYFTIFSNDLYGGSNSFDSSSPNELIDYR